MTRISENSVVRSLTSDVYRNRNSVNKYAEEISSGVKAPLPGDTPNAGSISQFREALGRIEGYKNRTASAKSFLSFQDDVLAEAGDLLLRGKEIATQAASDTVSTSARRQMAEEVYQIRDHMVALANSTYQGKYVFGGNDDDDPPFDPNPAGYVDTPATSTPAARVRAVFDAEPGTSGTRSIKVSDDVSIQVNTPGDDIFARSIRNLEVLGRALEGYSTDTATNTGAAYDFPAQYGAQSQAIRDAITTFDAAREQDIQIERVNIGGRLRRIDTAESVLDLGKGAVQEVLDRLQNADVTESASNLAQAQNALEASMTVTARVLGISILDYI